jgi:hypothetical protein
MEGHVDDAGIGTDDTALERAAVDPESLRALAVDTDGRTAPADPHVPAEDVEERAPRRWRRLPLRSKLLFGAAVVPCLAILVLAVMRGRDAPAVVDAPKPTAAAPVAATAPPPTDPATPATVVTSQEPAPPPPEEPLPKSADPAEQPAEVAGQRPTMATIAISSHARSQGSRALFVDGRRAKSTSVDVACGKHTVALDKGKPRQVDVACGRTALVDTARVTITKSAPPEAKSKSKR